MDHSSTGKPRRMTKPRPSRISLRTRASNGSSSGKSNESFDSYTISDPSVPHVALASSSISAAVNVRIQSSRTAKSGPYQVLPSRYFRSSVMVSYLRLAHHFQYVVSGLQYCHPSFISLYMLDMLSIVSPSSVRSSRKTDRTSVCSCIMPTPCPAGYETSSRGW